MLTFFEAVDLLVGEGRPVALQTSALASTVLASLRRQTNCASELPSDVVSCWCDNKEPVSANTINYPNNIYKVSYIVLNRF